MQTGQGARLNRVMVAALVALGLSATTGRAAGREGVFLVGPDLDAYRRSELAVLDAEVRTALADAAAADPYQIDSVATEDAISIFVRDDARTPGIIAAVRGHFAGRPDVALSVSPVELHRVSFPQQLLTSASDDRRMGRALYLEQVVRDARADPQGVDIRREKDGVVVRVSDPTRRSEIAAALRHVFPRGAFQVTAMPDQSWRVTMDSGFFEGTPAEAADLKSRLGLEIPDPSTRRVAPEAMDHALRDELREPRDLGTIARPEGLVVLIPDPERYPAFRTRLKQVLSSHPDLVESISSAQLLTIRQGAPGSNAKVTGDPADVDAAERLAGAWYEVGDLIDPPAPGIETKPTPDGLEISTGGPAHRADVAATIRRHFAGRPIVVELKADQSLRLNFAEGYLASKVPQSSALAENVRACLGAWNLSPARVSVVAGNRIEVVPARRADTETFRRAAFTRCGFSMRLVDRDADADPAEPPPNPGDERFPRAPDEPSSPGRGPQRGSTDLWLKPGVFITADMVAEARVGVGMSGGYVVRFKLTEEGRRRFAAVTTVNIDQRLAIVLDGLVLSAPVIRGEITAGQGEIGGNFTKPSARSLAKAILASGPQFPLRIEEAGATR